MDKLPVYLSKNPQRPEKSRSHLFGIFTLISLALCCATFTSFTLWQGHKTAAVPKAASSILQKCRLLNMKPGPPLDFDTRTVSDRFETGTAPVLIKNATIWTGRVSGLEIVQGDILLDQGLIKAVGSVDASDVIDLERLVTVDAGGSWVTPGIVDMHSHLGVDSVPALNGASDTNSLKGLVQPWLRSLDGLNTHDEAYRLSISGGVTTANVLPGSANSIGGQAFTIKLRPTRERSSSSMLLEPPFTLNGTKVDPTHPPRWRQMKHACGENPSRVYGMTRMDTIWALRQGYETARRLKVSQDEYCAQAQAGLWNDLGEYPEDLRWEALVDVLRGRVKIHNHCYEAVDLDGIVRLTNEFKFSIAAFHHAHETYLVPDLLKKAYGHSPAVALFATNGRYKREAYRGSEFAPRILADHGLSVVMKSDHPVLNSRHLLYEAQQAHYYGLPSNLALASVTSTPATVMGMDHRIGFISKGFDADVVIWDSHPLALGATPKQVYIDGISQLTSPHVVTKPKLFQRAPKTPNFDKEAADAVKYDGLPPLEPEPQTGDKAEFVIFSNVSSMYRRSHGRVEQVFSVSETGEPWAVVVHRGEVLCRGNRASCAPSIQNAQTQEINLEGGSIAPGLLSYGSAMGLGDIAGETSTNDGFVFDPLAGKVPGIVGGDESVIRAVDGLQFASRDALLAYRSGGVVKAVVAPQATGFLAGLATAFRTDSAHKLVPGAVFQDVTALHVRIAHVGVPSVSTQIAALRRLLFGGAEGELGAVFETITSGKLPLVIAVQNADAMASLIRLKKEVEEATGTRLQMTFSGGLEAHLLAEEIGQAGIGVILTPSRPFPMAWEEKRILPGPPLTPKTSVSVLLGANVTVGVGIEEPWSARSTRFDIAWAALEAGGKLSKADAIALASTNLERLLGVKMDTDDDLVVTKAGSILDLEAKVVGVISTRRGRVVLM